jgi:hypothetical protein
MSFGDSLLEALAGNSALGPNMRIPSAPQGPQMLGKLEEGPFGNNGANAGLNAGKMGLNMALMAAMGTL